MTNQALVLLLAGIWVALLLPGAIRARRGDARTTVGSVGQLLDGRRPEDRGEPAVYRFNEAARAAMVAQDAVVADAVAEGVVDPLNVDLVDDVEVIRIAPRVPTVPTDELRLDAARRRHEATVAQRRSILLGLLGTTASAAVLAVVVGGVFVPVLGLSTVALAADVAWLRVRHLRSEQRREVVEDLGAVAAERAARQSSAGPVVTTDDDVVVLPEVAQGRG